jgi:hypothetical protein
MQFIYFVNNWGKKEGPDLILNEFIKTGSQTMTLTLVKLFNKILQCGKFPSVWNHSLISYIFVIKSKNFPPIPFFNNL